MGKKEQFRPLIFARDDHPKIIQLLAKGEVIFVSDIFEHCLGELFEIEYPRLQPTDPEFNRTKQEFISSWKSKGDLKKQGSWVYYPWLKMLVHVPSQKIFQRLRTSRNRNLITEEEQRVLQSKRVGIAGMSVGSNILNTLVLTGQTTKFKIADLDTISLPNLNRLMAPAYAVGTNKAVYFARKNFEVDPFLDINIYPNGLLVKNFESFFKDPPIDLFIDGMDNPYLKIQSRNYARKIRIPVVMATDNGDGVFIDVERYDLDQNPPLFNGRLKSINLNAIKEYLNFIERITIIAKMAGLAEATPRMQDSLGYLGKTLNAWPQLGTAALMSGVSVAFIARQIFLNRSMPSGRYKINLEEFLMPSFNSISQKLARFWHTKKILKQFKKLQGK